MLPCAWVYILTNKNNTTLYVGVTNDIATRLWEHRTKKYPKSFTARYNLFKLVFYEGLDSIKEAIEREKYIKGKKREWKEALIRTVNADWSDLAEKVSLNFLSS